jgi:menaquinone-dependent protoporphyrinogen oxidase
MTVLVTYASKHGATAEIAEAIAEVLQSQGVSSDVIAMEDVDTVLRYDAYVLGSAVYVGTWLRTAREFVDEHAHVIAARPTWLFSSGPVGTPPHPAASDEFDIGPIMAATGAREHHLFSGRLDREKLGPIERALTGALHVPAGDYREWDAVAAWATAIAWVLNLEVTV